MTTKNHKKTILLVAGGTGGHIFPAIAVADLMMTRGYRIVFLTDRKFLSFASAVTRVTGKMNFSLELSGAKNIKGRLRMLRMGFDAFLGIFTAMRVILSHKVDVVVGFGGYVSLPSVLAGFILRKKVAIHEQNAHMGLANRIGIWFSSLCMLGFKRVEGVPRFARYKTVFTGNPIRLEIKKLYQSAGASKLLDGGVLFKVYNRVNFIVTGGSQAASIFSKTVPMAVAKLPHLIKSKAFVYHQAPLNDVEFVAEEYRRHGIDADVRPFFNNIGDLLTSAHLLIARSGAGTLSEITCLGAPSILIPYDLAKNNHQLKNAMQLQEETEVVVMEQKCLTAKKLSDAIALLFKDNNLANMSASMRAVAVPDADVNIAMALEVMMYGRVVSDFFSDLGSSQKTVAENPGLS